MSSTNLAVTLAHAIAFLTEPLLPLYSAAQIIRLQALLDANLTALYAPTWSSKEPLRGSTRRCQVLSPACLPPRPIYAACVAAGVQWFDWIDALGGFEFEFYVDPGCVAIRANGKLTTAWAGNVAAPPLPTPRTGLASFSDAQNRLCSRKTVAQQLLEDDDDDGKILDLINDANWGPTAVASVFPSTRSSSPLSSGESSPYSRCSSRSSNSSSSDASSSSPSSAYSSLSKGSSGSSRRAKNAAGQRIFVDITKTDVTPYDGGKTTVLTGGVMLGGGPTKGHKAKQHSSSSWRSATRA